LSEAFTIFETFIDRQQNLTARINALQEEVRVLTSEIQKEEIRDNGVNEYLAAAPECY
jgi:hypothetical protein